MGHDTPEPEYVLTAFAFLNWTFAAGIWSNLSDRSLRRDLQRGLKDALVLKLSHEIAEDVSSRAAKTILLTDAFNRYVTEYTARMRSVGQADSRMATLFALEYIQNEFRIDDSVMDRIITRLVPVEGLAVAIESVAAEINDTAADRKTKGF